MAEITLAQWAERYILARDISAGYARLLRSAVAEFDRFRGCPALLGELSEVDVNRWARHLADSGQSPKTRHSKLGYLLAIWRDAWAERVAENEPRRVIRVRVPRREPVAWSLAQLDALVAGCRQLRGWYSFSGIRRRDFWETFFRVSFDTGLRCGDVLALRLEQFLADGRVQGVVQSKTGRPLSPQVKPGTLRAVQALDPWVAERGGVVFWWPACRERFYVEQRRVVLAAGLSMSSGGSRRIRRSGATVVDEQQPGMAWMYLGHAAPGLDHAAYIDRSIQHRETPSPPELGS